MFRRRRTEKMLSADELKTKLYSHLDKTGSLNRMRTELREKLISELLKKAAPVETSDVSNPVYTFDRTVLPLQISNWLIYDHLLRQGYQYALSIFVTEANFPTHPEKLLAACDILILLGLDSTSPEYKNITQMCSTSNAQFTHSLLVAVIKCLFDLTTREGRFSETKEQRETLEESEQRVLPHEKNFDLTSSELKESDKFQKQRKGSADLSLHDQVLLIREEKEKEVQQLRHKLMQELDRLHSQERKQQLEIEQLQNELQREKDDLFSEKEKLKQRQLLIDKEYENKLEKKTRELEIDFISKIHAKENEQEILQQKLHEKEQKLNLLEMNLSNQRESYISLKRELEDMKHLHTTLQTKYSNLLDENTNLLKKFESMSDYAVLKGDLETKSMELKNLHLEFEEYRKKAEKEKESFRENLHKLDTKLRIKEPELLESQRQLNLARDTLHMEEAVWHKERRKLEQEVMSSREMYQTLIQRIEEQKEDIQALHRTIHILHFQLTDKSARNTARVEPFIPNRASFRGPDISRKEPDLFRMNRGNDDSPSKYRQNSLKFIEDAKNRISKLQQEADDLQYKSSVVYSSVPKITSRVTSNPLLLNFSSEERFQPSTSYAVKPFVSELPSTNFENLIRNELPTLDLSFPPHINSQLASAYRNVYQSESSVNAQATAAERNILNVSDKSLKYSENLSKKSNAYSTLHSDTSSPKKNHQNNNTGLFKVARETEVNKQFDLNNSTNSKVLSNESVLKESSSSNTRFSVTTPSNVHGNKNSDLSVIKTGGGEDEPSKKYDGNTQNLSGNISQETSTPAHVRTLTRNLNEGKSEASVEHENENKVSESVVKKTSAFQQVSETPVVVDLDAAWKRKSSLKSSILTPLHRKLSTEITSKEIDIAQTKSSQLQNVEQDLVASSSNKSNLSENVKEADLSHRMGHQNVELQRVHQESNSGDSKMSENSKEVESNLGMGHQSMEQRRNIQVSNSGDSKLSENSKEIESSHIMEPLSSSNESKVEATKVQETEPLVEKKKETEKIGTISADISKPVHSGEEHREVLSDQKPVHEDSLSELSEIHLSCGSEQEQQKEDSDNW